MYLLILCGVFFCPVVITSFMFILSAIALADGQGCL